MLYNNVRSFSRGLSLQDPNSFRASSTPHHGRPPPLTAALEASLRNYNARPSSEQPAVSLFRYPLRSIEWKATAVTAAQFS